MSRLKRLIQEIHRRSLWQVLLIYIGAAWACFELIATVADTMGLPGWLPGLAIVLFLLGLPFVVAAALVREEPAPSVVPPEATEAEARRVEAEVAAAGREATRRHRSLTWRNAGLSFLIAFGVWGVVATGWLVFGERATPEEVDARKSIAVLPLENLSREEATEPFTDGIHDDILTHLSKIADLKVISRTSVLEYRDRKKNLREIADELGVATILEGGVQRAGNRVRINVQLIDAETDEHLWAETYEEDLTTERIFAIQTDIAWRIATALRAQLTSEEQERIATRPTDNLEAYEYYQRGRYANDLTIAERMYRQAIELDPNFALAYAGVSGVYTRMYFGGSDPTEQRLAAAKAAAERALELEPDLPEAHEALGYFYVNGTREYERAMREYSTVLEIRPNDAWAHDMLGTIYRRWRGEWERSTDYFKRAAELNPRDSEYVLDLAVNNAWLRNHEVAESIYASAIALRPDRSSLYFWKAWTHLNQEDGSEKAWAALEASREHTGEVFPGLSYTFSGRTALRTLHEHYRDAWRRQSLETAGKLPQTYYIMNALSFDLTGEVETSVAYFDSARVVLEQRVSELPDDHPFHDLLGIAYAGLGRRNEAIREAQRAVELLPVSRDHLLAPFNVATLAEVYVMVGEYDAAIDQLEYLLSIPSPMSPPLLRADPLWAPLRDHPRFQALVDKYE